MTDELDMCCPWVDQTHRDDTGERVSPEWCECACHADLEDES